MLLALAAVVCAHAQDLTRFEVKTKEDVAALASIPEWRRGANTNGITIAVQCGIVECGIFGSITLTRELTFDADGKLVRASPPALSSGRPLEKTLLDALSATDAVKRKVPTSKSRYTPARPTEQPPSAKPSGGGK